MALHPTRKQSNFELSLRKQILDHCGTLPIFFELIEDIPKDSNGDDYLKWCVLQIGDKVGEDLVEQLVFLHVFTYKDAEGDQLAILQDDMMGIFTDVDGALPPFPLYEVSDWSIIGGVSVFEQNINNVTEDFNGAKFKTITLLCKWNAV